MRKKFTRENLQHIDHQFDDLMALCKNYLDESEIERIGQAYDFASQTCLNQFDKDGNPLIINALQVSIIAVSELGLSTISIIAALLHDLPVYTNISLEEIEESFGQQIAGIIEGLNKIRNLYTENLSLQTENFIKLLLSLSDDIRIILLTLADRLYAMRHLEWLAEDEKQNLARETTLLYAPIAHRLGLYRVKTELEELAMKELETGIYKTIAKKLQETKAKREKYIADFIDPLKKELENFGHNVEIIGRPKSIHSIWNKMKKQGVEFEEVYDLFAIRIIIDTGLENEKADCWKVYSIVTNHYTPNPRRLRDWISTPKASGYESLHTTVVGPDGKWVEVQIRTARMNEIAEKGHASHWKYKESGKSSSTDDWLHKVREVLEKPVIDDVELTDDAKISLYSKDIFIFTPNGDIKKLKKNSTVLDFAFSIHSNIGSTCTGAKVNGKIVPFKHVLSNGDKVEIQTSKTQTPKQDWLNIVTSPRAKSKIKRALKQKQFEKAEEGRELLHRKLNQQKLEFNDEIVNYLIGKFKLKSALELYQRIGEGKINFADIKSHLQITSEKDAIIEEERLEEDTKISTSPKTQRSDYLIIDKNLDGIDYRFSKCCNPVYGDDVFGFITINSGTKIHRKDCPNAQEMWKRYPYRFVETRWSAFDHQSTFPASLYIQGIDRAGIVNNITKVITTDLEIEMRSVTVDSKSGVFEGKIEVFIKEKSEIDVILKSLKKIKGILTVQRL